MEACCTCATLLSEVPRISTTEKPLPDERRLECCGRVICGDCIKRNVRFSRYCPYCQISESTSVLPQGLKEPPSYGFVTANPTSTVLLDASPDAPPPYTSSDAAFTTNSKDKVESSSSSDATPPYNPPAADTLHFLDHAQDSIGSLSIRYNVPVHALRRANRLAADHLLAARRTIVIPGAWYRGGVSHSPRPVEGEEEEARKAKIRRFMMTTKVADYEVAVFYLEAAGYELEDAVWTYSEDERWEKENPIIEDQDKTGQWRKQGKKVGNGQAEHRRELIGRIRRRAT